MFTGAREIFRLQGVLLGLVLAMFLIFFAQEWFGEKAYEPWMAVPAEVIQSWNNIRGGNGTASDWQELSTLLSCAFLHADVEHVGGNMLFMWIFAALAVELLGVRWMLLIFTITAVSATLAHIALNREDMTPLLGASGAVMGFEGAYLGLALRWRLPNPHVWPIAHPIPPERLALLAVIGVAMDYYSIISKMGGNVAYGAHVGGFVAGLLLGALIAPRPRGRGITAR